ncbi:MAG: MarC family protein [Candidatus Omnitrophica bacterium]|nr:MarC family protein [Candidatus Omnitrophota bacterium]MDD5487748.1 MarC family protein [Candidatus Omnitrophota bacterium]
MRNIFLAFIPVFVAVDAIGVLPIFVSLTVGLRQKEKLAIIVQSLVTAVCLAVFFIFLGQAVFKLLGITMGDFMIAGGAILFCIAIIDIITPGKQRRRPVKDLGAVPIGTPLIVGPAVLTTSLVSLGQYGLVATLVSVLVNILIAGAIFSFSGILIKGLGEGGAKALSKVMSLLLAAIAVMLVRKGVVMILLSAPL